MDIPGQPILPAVVQLMAGSITAIEAAGKLSPVCTISRAKFVRPIGPNESLSVAGSLKQKDDKTLAAITIHVGKSSPPHSP